MKITFYSTRSRINKLDINIIFLITKPSRLKGVMVIVLVIGPKVRGFKPGRDDGF
jgi:hypothetical protein